MLMRMRHIVTLSTAKLRMRHNDRSYKIAGFNHTHTAGKISIEHVTIFLSKNISKGAIDMKFSPDVGNNPSNPYIQRKQIK